MAKNSIAVGVDAQRNDVSKTATRDLLPAELEMDFRETGGCFVLACLNEAITDANAKREALALQAGMSPAQFSKVTGADVDRQGLHKVLDSLPQDIFVDFMKRYGQARGLKVREEDTAELTDEFLATVDRMVALGRLLRLKRPKAAKARMP